MERAWLAERLAGGASIEAIAQEAGCHPSTVAYWLRKHGLVSAHAPRHAARGGIDRQLLAEVVACELSVRDMADVFDRSPTTIRHWLRRHGLETARMTRERLGKAALAAGLRTAEIPCPRHGMSRHVRRKGGSAVPSSRSSYEALRAQSGGGVALDGRSTGGGGQMRAPVRELSC